MSEEEVISGVITGRMVDKVIKLCKYCSLDAGYHVKMFDLPQGGKYVEKTVSK